MRSGPHGRSPRAAMSCCFRLRAPRSTGSKITNSGAVFSRRSSIHYEEQGLKFHRNHVDFAMLVAVLALMLLSLGVVYSASASYALAKYGESERMLTSHALKVLLGMLGLFIGLRVDYHKLQRLTKWGVAAAVGLLFVTLVLGGETKGATRWLRYSSIGFQPSEFAKYALLFHLCTLMAVKGELITDFKRGFVPVMVWVGAITGLVMLQPNFSMGSMIFLLSLVLLFIGRAKLSHLGLTFAVLVPVL